MIAVEEPEDFKVPLADERRTQQLEVKFKETQKINGDDAEIAHGFHVSRFIIIPFLFRFQLDFTFNGDCQVLGSVVVSRHLP